MKPVTRNQCIFSIMLGTFFIIYSVLSYADTLTPNTIQTLAEVSSNLPFEDTQDLHDIKKGFIARPEKLMIKDKKGGVVWNFTPYKKFENTGNITPQTVNPSLWRQAQLNSYYGLFEVTKNIYQVRGYDISNITIIASDNGYIVVDPLISKETAKAAMDLFFQHFPKKPIKAVIYTHSHLDHFGGVKGVVSEEDVKKGQVKIIAPEGFMDEAIKENIMIGNAMSRRAQYMYGSTLPINPTGLVDNGIGKNVSNGETTLIAPTDTITKDNEKINIDGVEFIFQLTPGTEAPSEMNFYLPQFRALCMAENAVHTLHNLYTLRGAQVRDAKAWAHYLNQTIDLFSDKTNVVFASHNWPMWGNKQIVDFLENQRDTYKYIHDQSLRLANEGYTMDEIANNIHLPHALSKQWYSHGYYGTVNHNSKAVYQKYLGWFDANPAHLNPLPPEESSKKIVEYMGGEAAVMKKAQLDFEQGNYRWVAQVLNDVVFANPDNTAAKELEAKALEQMGYQAESSSWRNFYLTGAQELRQKDKSTEAAGVAASPDIIRSMRINEIVDYLAIHLNGERAVGHMMTLNLQLPDIHEKYIIQLKNSVLNHYADKAATAPDLSITLDRATLDALILKDMKLEAALKEGKIVIDGNSDKLKELYSLLDTFDPSFNIVTP